MDDLGTTIDGTRKVLRAFEALSRIWRLTGHERLKLLGLSDQGELDRLGQLPLEELPIDLIERIFTLANIAGSVRTLLPRPTVAAGWIRKPNRHALFSGRSALDLMLEKDLEGMRAVRSYLLAEVTPLNSAASFFTNTGPAGPDENGGKSRRHAQDCSKGSG